MNININDKSLMTAALKKAAEDNPFDALCLFAQVDSYESLLNQIGCLGALNDLSYAVALFRRLLSRYFLTHNCVDDVKRMGDAAAEVLRYFGNDLRGELAVRDERRISADPKLLGRYTWGGPDDDEEDMEPDFADGLAALREIINSYPEEQEERFFDVNSPEYAEYVRERMISAFMGGDIDKAIALQKEFMTVNAGDELTLELQMLMCYSRRDWKGGVAFALKIASRDDATYRGLGMSVETLYNAHAHPEVMEEMLLRMLEFSEEIPDTDMMNYIQMSSSALGYGDTTLALCDVLFSHYEDAGCSALNLCARVYYNCGRTDLSREATLLLLRAAPWDGSAKAMLHLLNGKLRLRLSDPLPLYDSLRRFDVPRELSAIAKRELERALSADGKLHPEAYCYVDCRLKYCYGKVVSGDTDGFIKASEEFSDDFAQVEPSDPDSLVAFIKDCLADALSEITLSRCFLKKLIQLKCRDKIFLSLMRGYYTLDLGRLSLYDERFVDVFCLCATLRKVDAKRMEKVYLSLKDKLRDETTDREIAYAMLALGYKNFTESDESNYFSDDEKTFYSLCVKD